MADPEVSMEDARQQVVRISEASLGRAAYQRQIRDACTAALRAINEVDQAREAELAVVRSEFQKEIDRERARAVQTAADLAAEREKAVEAVKSMDKLLELKDDHAALRFTAPVGDYGRHTPWTVDDLEEVIYDIRHAGGVGETEVLLSDRQVTTKVPYPETVVAARVAKESGIEVHDPKAGKKEARRDARILLAVFAAVCFALYGLLHLVFGVIT